MFRKIIQPRCCREQRSRVKGHMILMTAARSVSTEKGFAHGAFRSNVRDHRTSSQIIFCKKRREREKHSSLESSFEASQQPYYFQGCISYTYGVCVERGAERRWEGDGKTLASTKSIRSAWRVESSHITLPCYSTIPFQGITWERSSQWPPLHWGKCKAWWCGNRRNVVDHSRVSTHRLSNGHSR